MHSCFILYSCKAKPFTILEKFSARISACPVGKPGQLVSEPRVNGFGWNPIQAGMVKKAVIDKVDLQWAGQNAHEFGKLCLAVYEAFEVADALIKQVHPEVAE